VKFVVAWNIINVAAYQTFRQLYLANCSPEDLEDPGKLIQTVLAYAAANKPYIDSFPHPSNEIPASSQGQAYVGQRNFGQAYFGQSYMASEDHTCNRKVFENEYMQSPQVTEFMSSPQGQAYKSEVQKPGGHFFPLQHGTPFQPSESNSKAFRVVGSPVTDKLRFCHDCYIRTGKCYTNHGNPGQSACTNPSLERNPEATAIKSYISELMINPTSDEALSKLQLMDDLVTMLD
jgi:hypothetical protein